MGLAGADMRSLLFRIVLFATLFAAFLPGCGKKAAEGPPPPTVSVSKPLPREIVESDEYPGRLESPQTVNLAARVSGIIEKAPFQEGAIVHQGDTLFIIDERTFKADFASKEADVMSAEAMVAQATAHFNRYAKLQGTKAISAESYDESVASLSQAKANLAVAKAARDVSKLNLEWTKVTAPITGKISRKYVTEGNWISAGVGLATPLTTITSVDPMYFYANIPERTLVKYQNLEKQLPAGQRIPCSIKLETEANFTHQGMIDFIDSRVDSGTGTVQIRCQLPNPDGVLLSGQFAKLRIPGSERYTTLLIPDVAVGTDQNTKYALVLGNENTVEARQIKLGPLFGKLRAVSEGLKPDDRVVVNGIQLARPGAKVNPTEIPVPTDSLDAALPSTASLWPDSTEKRS